MRSISNKPWAAAAAVETAAAGAAAAAAAAAAGTLQLLHNAWAAETSSDCLGHKGQWLQYKPPLHTH